MEFWDSISMSKHRLLWVIAASVLLVLIPLGFTGSSLTVDRSDDAIPAEESAFEAGDSLELIKFWSELSTGLDLAPWRLQLTILYSSVIVFAVYLQRMQVSFLFCRPPPATR